MSPYVHRPKSTQNVLSLSFDCLPNELLHQILAPIPTKQLLPITLINRRFHTVVHDIIYRRLHHATSSKHHALILECYHPASKSTEPWLSCTYLGTPVLDNKEKTTDGTGHRISDIGKLYSHFRPTRRLEKPARVPHPAGDVPNRPNNSTTYPDSELLNAGDSEPYEELVSHTVSLDAEECFSQLCVSTTLVKPGPRRGVFEALVDISEGVVRMWREWLKVASAPGRATMNKDTESKKLKEIGTTNMDNKDQEKNMLWADHKKTIGLQVNITQRQWPREVPLLWQVTDDPAVSYKVEFEELQVRTGRLLLKVEELMLQDRNDASGKAMVFGSFVRMS